MNVKNLIGWGCHPLFKRLKKHREGIRILFILFIILVSTLVHYNCGTREALQILVYPPRYLIPGAEASLRVIVLEPKTGQPTPDARVTIHLKKPKKGQPELLFQGKTNAYGTPQIAFNVPAGMTGDCELTVEADSPSGNNKVSIPITVRKGFKILLTTDKAAYCPGQTIHIRGLVFAETKAADQQKMNVEVYEPGGNRVFAEELQTCIYGIAQTGFTLGDEIRTGIYTIKANTGNDWVDKQVRVSEETPDRLSAQSTTKKSPGGKNKKESISLSTDKTIYNIGETPILTISSTLPQGVVYVDVLKENQIILTTETKLANGKTNLTLPMVGIPAGTLFIHARIPVPGKEPGSKTPFLTDRREVMIQPAKDDEIAVTIKPTKEKYYTGEEATLDVITMRRGQPCMAALIITVTDGPQGEGTPTPAGKEIETIYFNPRLITGRDGKATVAVRLGQVDSKPVTPWQVSASAHTLDGVMGRASSEIKVIPGIRVELDLPPLLTEGDEIGIPTTIENDDDTPYDVTLALQPDNWYELRGNANRKLKVNAGDRKMEYFKIKAKAAGTHRLTMEVSSPVRRETVAKDSAVEPLGKEIKLGYNYKLKGGDEIRKRLVINETALPGRDKLMVKVYPGFLSQVVNGMESMLQYPHGCFEQSTSITYPNIIVLDYLRKAGKSNPTIEKKAKEYISHGYQKLLAYETEPGGFAFYGGSPKKVLTAYGLLIFSDMAKVYPIEKGLIPRIQQWLLSRITNDHWEPDGHFGASAYAMNNPTASTAYITWALLHSGLDKNNKKIQEALDYLEKNHHPYLNSPPVLSIYALSLIKAQKNASRVLQRLNELAKNDRNGIYWTPDPYNTSGTPLSSISNIETTAIATLANLEANNRSLDIMQILYYLLMNKNTTGTWGNTQSTVLTLKVITKVLPGSSEAVFGKASIYLDNELAKEILFKEDNNILMQVVDLQDFANKVSPGIRIKFRGKGELFCQVLSSYYLKWDDPSIYRRKSPINLELTYDKQRLQRGELLNVKAVAAVSGKKAVNFAIVDIGIPPGFKPDTGEFREMRAKGLIDRYEIDSGRIVLYLNNLDQKGKQFQFGLQAITEAFVKMPAARIYDYYNPQMIQEVKPVQLTVI
jgi:uncharacterized protein YfaS (alpha-2-macroglobulin family)